ncbi:PASTA domain-containing protein [[Mycobacterium] burgundiense]|uniref:PASTA domain-containing protein n=1 Tax=[Mycobacterium] burgundiense TaxID=3064286 RepID=A0ABM9LYW2_9MYCO|nr:PASTA domain-containing protein [Mycolicibacterium sp. MU0053]CAJ1507068.1 PASTA domain-containing protein [Mycolicibacterium sp. MU0053]
MIKFLAPAAAVGAVALAAGLTFAGPAAADDPEWEMPDLVGATLEQAESSVAALSDQITFETEDLTGLGREQLSPANWTVCATVPEAGETLTADSTVGFVVVRQHQESCE